MSDHARIIELMEQKRRYLRSIEDVTQEMITSASERLETLMIQRDKQMAQLQRADMEMQDLCKDAEDGPAILDAALCRSEPEKLTGTLLQIYQLGQQQRASVGRLRETEMQAILRLKQEQLEILEKIEATNQSGAAKAARFFTIGSGQGGGSRLGHA